MVILLLLSHGLEMLDNNWRLDGKWKMFFSEWSVGAAESGSGCSFFPPVSVKDHTVSSDVTSLKVPNT